MSKIAQYLEITVYLSFDTRTYDGEDGRLNSFFMFMLMVVAKSCNRTEFGKTYGNSRMGAGRIYGKVRKHTVFRYRDLVQ